MIEAGGFIEFQAVVQEPTQGEAEPLLYPGRDCGADHALLLSWLCGPGLGPLG
jgi:hypothetical protein